MVQLSRAEQARDLAVRAPGALRGFAAAFQVSIGELTLEVDSSAAADSGNLELDLPELLVLVGKAARAGGRSVTILIDEIQDLNREDLRALIVAFHRVSQGGLPVVLFGAGLPQVAGLAGDARSYAERLFDFPPVGALSNDAAAEAVARPLSEEGVGIARDALARIVALTRGDP